MPGGTDLGIRMVPDAILIGSKPYFSGSNFGERPIIAVFQCATWKCARLMFSAEASFVGEMSDSLTGSDASFFRQIFILASVIVLQAWACAFP